MTRKGEEGIFGGKMGTENPTHFPYYEGGNDLINFGGSLVNQDSVSLPILPCCAVGIKIVGLVTGRNAPNSHPLLD